MATIYQSEVDKNEVSVCASNYQIGDNGNNLKIFFVSNNDGSLEPSYTMHNEKRLIQKIGLLVRCGINNIHPVKTRIETVRCSRVHVMCPVHRSRSRLFSRYYSETR